MSQATAVPYECTTCPSECVPTQVPGAPGADGADGAAGAMGANAYTVLLAGFTMPAVGNTEIIEVGSTAWMVPEESGVAGQALAVQFAGTLLITAIVDSTHVEVRNDGYTGNAPGGSLIPIGSKVGVSGVAGVDGAGAGLALLIANDLADVNNAATSRTNLGLGSAAVLSAAAVLQSANNLADLANAATARTNLGVAIGTNVQAFSAFLAGFVAAGPGVVDRMPYLTGANAWALTAFTSFARGIGAASTQDTAKKYLGVRQGLLGVLVGADLNTAGDVLIQVMTGAANQRVRVRQVVLENASISLTTATAGLFSSAGGIGTIAADQALATATGPNVFFDFAVTGASVLTATDFGAGQGFFFRVGVVQGAPATANIWIFGDDYT